MPRTRQLGRYQVTERIAFGGMAEIFRGFTYDEDGFRRDVAIKKVLPNYTDDRHFVDMLTDEFKLVSYLRHPNIAEVYELAEVDESLLISMEFIDGKDLRSTVEKGRQRREPLDFDDVTYILARALDGLHHAHIARDLEDRPLHLVHRDFSPSNILIAYDGHVKICDFGIAKAANNKVQTRTGIIKGKIKYMSPEQAFGRKLDGRSDIFSAGSVLYELATGVAPFNAGNELDLIFAVRDANPRPATELNPHIPGPLAAIIERAMARSRSARYQSALEFRDDLLIFLREFNAQYRRTKLARTMKRLWATEIETELRLMEEYVISEAVNADLGVNLIADVLGPDAAYQRFHPNPGTRSAESILPQNQPGIDPLDAGTSRIDTGPGADKGRPRRTTKRVEDSAAARDRTPLSGLIDGNDVEFDERTDVNEDGDTKRR